MDVESWKDSFADEFVIVEVAFFIMLLMGIFAGLCCEDGVFYALGIAFIVVQLLASENEGLDAEVKLASEVGLQSSS